MASEVHYILAQVKLLVNITHGGLFGVDTFHGLGVILIKVGHVDEELPEPPLLKETH